MGKIKIQIQSDLLTAESMMKRLKDPKWNYFNLKNYLSLFTDEDISKVEHVYECISNQDAEMIIVQTLGKNGSCHVYCVSIAETEEKEKEPER